MNDRELLEAAARAAGHKYSAGYIDVWDEDNDHPSHAAWDPLENDGDAFRLMVDLKMKIQCIGTREQVRRAIVSVAAQMVKT